MYDACSQGDIYEKKTICLYQPGAYVLCMFVFEDYLTECSSPFSQLHRLVHISVHECAVSHAGQKEEISGTCPSIRLEGAI